MAYKRTTSLKRFGIHSTKLKKDYVTEFISGILTNFTNLSPHFKDKKIYTELVPSPKSFKLHNFHP